MSKAQKQESTEFDSVMQELESFSKSYAGMDEAGDDMPKRKAKAKKEEMVDRDEDEGDEQDPAMTKSVNHDEGQAMDAEAFMGEFLKKSKIVMLDATKEAAAESMKISALLAKALVEQGRLTKSLADEVAGLRESLEEQGQQPRMRKSVLNIQDRQHGQLNNGTVQEGIPASAVLAKCVGDNGLVAKGIVTPSQVSQVQYYANRGQELPANLKYLEQHV